MRRARKSCNFQYKNTLSHQLLKTSLRTDREYVFVNYKLNYKLITDLVISIRPPETKLRLK